MRRTSDQRAQRADRRVEVGRVAGPGGDEDRVGPRIEHVALGCIVRQDRDLRAEAFELLQDRALDAAVYQDDARAVLRAGGERFARRHARHELLRIGGSRERRERVFGLREGLLADRERRPDRSVFAQCDRDRARVGTDERRESPGRRATTAGLSWLDDATARRRSV